MEAKNKTRKYDLEERLIKFAVEILDLTEKLPKNYASVHIGKQLVRSGTSPALNYAEAQAAESRQDFLHKIKIVLKELRETLVSLKIISLKKYLNHPEVQVQMNECNELISIFVKTTQTVRNNIGGSKK